MVKELITKNIINAFTGTTPVKAIYRGTNKIWESGSGPVPPEPTEWVGLTLTAVEPSEFTLSNKGTNEPNLEYSVDDGVNWSTVVASNAISLAKGQKMYLRGDNSTISTSTSNYSTFLITGNAKLSGNIMSVLSKTGFKDMTSVGTYCFYRLFHNSTGISDASELSLPATTLADSCYFYMFQGCGKMTSTPVLPATTLANSCYNSMFMNCNWLTSAPTLPATTLSKSCYASMFQNCSGLTSAPELPATTLTQYCYSNMFYGCSGLTSAPELPATTLAEYCYNSMFQNCSGLTSAPELPATTLAGRCYYAMFQNCSKLTSTPVLPATTLTINCYYNMFYGCKALTHVNEIRCDKVAESSFNGMFYNCTALTEVPEINVSSNINVRNTFRGMFQKCTSLTKQPVINYTSILYTNTGNDLLGDMFTESGVTDYYIPESCNTLSGVVMNVGNGINIHYTKLTSDFTKIQQFSGSVSSSTYQIYNTYFEDSIELPEDYNVRSNVITSVGSSKRTITHNIYTDNQTIYNQLNGSGNEYTIINVYHLDGSEW